MINCVVLVLLLLVSMVLLKCTNFTPVIHFLNAVRLFNLWILFIIILPTSFCDLLSPLVPNDYSCKDTFSFVCQIRNENLYKKVLVSYNVTILFTNTPIQETIAKAINLIFNNNPNLNITKTKLKKFFSVTPSQTHFICSNKFYNHIDGVVMGCSLAPVLANISIGFYESKWLNEYNLNKPTFYLRYVKDNLVACDNEQDSLNF